MDSHHPLLQPTRDHVVPQVRGGTEIVICCSKCNTIKGAMMPEEWAAFCTEYPRWWAFTRAEIRAAKGHRRLLKRGRFTGISTVVPAKLIYRCGEEKAHPPMADALEQLQQPDAE